MGKPSEVQNYSKMSLKQSKSRQKFAQTQKHVHLHRQIIVELKNDGMNFCSIDKCKDSGFWSLHQKSPSKKEKTEKNRRNPCIFQKYFVSLQRQMYV